MMAACGTLHAASLPLLTNGNAPTVLTDGQETLGIAADLLRRDIGAVTGQPSSSVNRLEDCAAVCFVIGKTDSALIAKVAKLAGIDLSWMKGQWERYERVVLTIPSQPGKRIVLIAGSDTRGAVYGTIDVSREIGVSAWEWWADVQPAVRPDASISDERIQSKAPSVQYRGIFLNDEDWGLQPWAARRDPSGDIGPATYARIFELMMRLKANLIWPAMHDSTKPFYQIPGNAAMAKKYSIVVGTSHAEPMMRNNVREWNHSKRGDFNFFTNRKALVDYWAERAVEVKHYENIYSVGIRGVHDTAMEGATTVSQARDAVREVIDIERGLLAKAQGKPADKIPQALTLYKEVLDIYKAGLVVPDDITLLWPDDNYGYLHQLSTTAEARRSGGTGLYYHLSYWGRPHDYLWLGTTHPALIRDQLQRAVATNTRKTWVVNVGDIKPIEYLTQYFLDVAFNIDELNGPSKNHLKQWLAKQFGPVSAEEIASVLMDYYDLAWDRRPEFMGFSQVESITPVRQSDYMLGGGEEAEQRLLRYKTLVDRTRAIGKSLPEAQQETYFQLVQYPIQSAANLNQRILKLDLASQYAREGRPVAALYAKQAMQAQQAIDEDTKQYNSMGNGKWSGMMDAAPRKLPVFDVPTFPAYGSPTRKGCELVYPTLFSSQGDQLNFTQGVSDARTLTIVQTGAEEQTWSLASSSNGIAVNMQGGTLNTANGFEQRISVRYDGKGDAKSLDFKCGTANLTAAVKLSPAPIAGLKGEKERIVSLQATEGTATAGWSAAAELGSYGSSMRANFDVPSRELGDAASAPKLSFDFATTTSAEARIVFVGLPVHALTSANKVRMAYSLDDGPIVLLDFETHGRSDEWKANVLSNTSVRSVSLPEIKVGAHKLHIYALDPGVILDRVEVRFDGAPQYYGKPL
ncbi:Glycosyl hydrolase family 115 [Duganella sp. CF402]|nr:glycosyl hydrolase family 115 (putative glucuronidase) [Duganella sp. BK701]SEM01884.1 Glycosyl hydrolase family 115 [Duganella sp. CF402]